MNYMGDKYSKREVKTSDAVSTLHHHHSQVIIGKKRESPGLELDL